jgi:hypothetical protein
MIRNILLLLAVIFLFKISYYAEKSCQIEPMIMDQDIHIGQSVDKLELTLDYASKLFNVIPDTKSDGQYIVAANKGFIGRVINQVRRDYPRYTAYQEACKYGLWEIQYQYICWRAIQKQKELSDMDEMAEM